MKLIPTLHLPMPSLKQPELEPKKGKLDVRAAIMAKLKGGK